MDKYLFPNLEYSMYLPSLFMSQLQRTAVAFPVIFEDNTCKGQLIVFGELITAITVHFGYAPDINNAVCGKCDICLDYLTNAKWITAQSASKFQWLIVGNESILLANLAQTHLQPGVGSYLLHMRGQERIAHRPLWTYHKQSIGKGLSSSAPMDLLMAVLD